MATNAHITTFDIVEDTLSNALWFIRHGRFLAALYALENALARCVDERRERIADLMNGLGNASVVTLATA